MDNFEILIGKYKAVIEVIYNSTQITRFKISLKEKHFILEKQHLQKSQKWKIKESSNDADLKKIIKLLPDITGQIETLTSPKSLMMDYIKNKKSYLFLKCR